MKKYVIIILSIVCFHGCQYLYEPVQIISKAEYIVLEWDTPSINVMGGFVHVKSYRVFYREHGSGYWVLLAEIPAEEKPKYTIYHSDLGDGLFDFAVNAVYENKINSALHTSRDITADPFGGWYLLWIRSE